MTNELKDELNCKLGAKMTLQQCHRRQLGTRRWTKGRFSVAQVLNPAFLVCVQCQNWIDDEEYNKRKTHKHPWGRSFKKRSATK